MLNEVSAWPVLAKVQLVQVAKVAGLVPEENLIDDLADLLVRAPTLGRKGVALLGGTARRAFKSSLIHSLKDSRVSGPETPAEATVLYLVVTSVMSRGLAVLP